MNTEDLLLAHLVAGLLALTLAGLVARHRTGLCKSFAVYLAFALVTNQLMAWWPSVFYTRWWWVAKELVTTGLKVIIVAELAGLAFEAFPRARRIAILAIALIVALTIVSVSLDGAVWTDFPTVRDVALARVQVGSLWSFAALVGVATWFRLPLHHFHRTILIGFTLYLGAYASVLSLMNLFGPDNTYDYLSILDPAAYAATVGLWLLGAWRREEDEETLGARELRT